MFNVTGFQFYMARPAKALSSPSREILLTLAIVAVTMNSVSLAALGRLTRPLTTFQINLVNLAVSDLMLAVTMVVALCLNIHIRAMFPPFQNPRDSEDGVSVLLETTNFTEFGTSLAFGEDTIARDSDGNAQFGLINLACFERFMVTLTAYFTLLPLIATTSLVYHQLTTVWHPLNLTGKYNKKPTAAFVILAYLIPAVSFSVGIIYNCIKRPQDDCLATLMSQSVDLALSGTGSIITAIAFIGNTVMLTLLLYKARKQMTQGPSKGMAKNAFKTSQTIAMLWGTVFVLWSAGVVVFTMVFSFDLISLRIPERFGIVYVVVTYLYMLNPLLDPIIYGLRIPEVRQAYTRMLRFYNSQKLNIREAPIDIATLNKRSVESHGTQNPCGSFEGVKF